MAVYTDGKHLVANSDEELHSFAKLIGLKREWSQDHRIHHYDLMKGKVQLAEEFGAHRVDTKQLILMYNLYNFGNND